MKLTEASGKSIDVPYGKPPRIAPSTEPNRSLFSAVRLRFPRGVLPSLDSVAES